VGRSENDLCEEASAYPRKKEKLGAGKPESHVLEMRSESGGRLMGTDISLKCSKLLPSEFIMTYLITCPARSPCHSPSYILGAYRFGSGSKTL